MSLVRFRPEAPFYADLAHLVERHLAKVEVASSSLVIRSIGALKSLSALYLTETAQKLNTAPWPSGKAGACKALIPSSILGGASKMNDIPNLNCYGSIRMSFFFYKPNEERHLRPFFIYYSPYLVSINPVLRNFPGATPRFFLKILQK